MKKLALLIASLFPVVGFAQQYSIDWHKIAGGGGTSTNGQYSVSGTIGQADASGAMTGGSYSLTGGYWSLIAVSSSPGVPNLTIIPNGPGSVKISWPNTGSFTLKQNSAVAPTSWTTSSYSMTTVNGTNSVIVTPLAGSQFFRLFSP